MKGYQTKLQRRKGQQNSGQGSKEGQSTHSGIQGRTAAQSGHLTLVGMHCWAA